VARSEGITFPHGFSARDLFQRIRTGVRPVPAMFRAVSLLKEAGKLCWPASLPSLALSLSFPFICLMMPSSFSLFSIFLKGFKTCAITNNWIDDTSNQTDQVDRFLSNYFDVVLQSCKLGIRKPDPRIYQLACQRLGIEPKEVGAAVCECRMKATATSICS